MKILKSIYSTLVSIHDELKAIKEQNANNNITFSGELKVNGDDLSRTLEKTIRQSDRTVGTIR